MSDADGHGSLLVRLNGSLGDQMFQYAFGQSLAWDLGKNLLLGVPRSSGGLPLREATLFPRHGAGKHREAPGSTATQGWQERLGSRWGYLA